MSMLRKRLDRLAPDVERQAFIVVAGNRTTEEDIRDAVRKTGVGDPFDIIHVVDAFGTPHAPIDIRCSLPFCLRETVRRSSAGEA